MEGADSQRREEDNEEECDGWGTSGMSALRCVRLVCERAQPACRGSVSHTCAAALPLSHTAAAFCFEMPFFDSSRL